MGDINWIHVVVSFLSGGAFGAVLKILWDKWSARQQPVRYRIRTESITRPATAAGDFEAVVAVRVGDDVENYTNLSLITIDLSNAGNRDLGEFNFGVTLADGEKCVYSEACGPDRHNPITVDSSPSPENASPTKGPA
jgi:hypothetical protein